jgi:hypothetical protein
MIGRALLEVFAPGATGAMRSSLRLHRSLGGAVLHAAGAAFRRPAAGNDDAIVDPAVAEYWRRRWAAYVLGAAAAVSVGIVAASAAPYARFAVAGLAALGIAGAARSGFENWRARTGGRGGWLAWRRSPSDWLPHDAPGASDGGRGWHQIGVGIAALIALAPAAATAAAPAAVAAATDQALLIINAILPGALSSSSGAVSPWATALGVWSSTLCGLGAFMLSYQVLIGTVQTAHHGQVLGGRFHTFFGPIRVAIGFGMLIPVTQGAGAGLCGGQILLAQAASASSTIASTIWASFASDVLGVDAAGNVTTTPTTGGTLGIPSAVGGAELARRVLTAEVCIGVVNATDYYQLPLPPTGGTANGAAQVWDYGSECGSISIPTATSPTPTASTPTSSASASTATDTQTYLQARITATAAIVTAERTAAAPLITASLPGAASGGGSWSGTGGVWSAGALLPALVSVGGTYETAMTAVAASYLAGEQSAARAAVVQQAQNDGWVSAGALWGTLGSASAAVSSLAATAPGYVDPEMTNNTKTAMHYLVDDLAAEDRTAGGVTAGQLADVGKPGDLFARLTSPLTTPISQALMSMATAGSLNDIQTEGHVAIGASISAILGGSAVAAASKNWLSDSVGVGAIWDWASWFVRPMIASIWLSGFMQAVILPLQPLIASLHAALGFAILLLEGVIAVPLLAFNFIKMADSNEEIVGGVQRTGLIIAMNICLRPILFVLSMIGVYYLVPICLGLVGRYFPIAWAGAQAGHTVTPDLLVACYVLLSYLQYQLVSRALGAVSEVPDRVLNWHGSPGGGLGDGGHVAAAAAVGAGIGRALPGGGGSGGGGSSSGKKPPGSPKKPGGGSIRPAGGGGGGPLAGGSSGGGGGQLLLAGPAGSSSGGGGSGGGYEHFDDGRYDGGGDDYGGDDGGGFRSGGDKWFNVPSMTEEHEADAQEAYEAWKEGREDKGGRISFNDYKSYVRAKHAGEQE